MPPNCKARGQLYTPPQSSTWVLTVRGNYLDLRQIWNWNQSPKPTRGEVRTPFSRSSRMRLLKEIAAIQWNHYKDFLFVTLTYPDSRIGRTIEQQTQDRSLFVRYIEKHVGRPVGVLWRKEWKIRQSGACKGQLAPHWHLLLFGCAWIDHRQVRRWWRTILGVSGPLATDVRSAASGEHAARYTAKYVSKAECSGSLDNPAYLNKAFGRPWGFCRNELVPRHAELHLPDLGPAELERLRQIAHRLYNRVNPEASHGFTVFHEDVGKVFKLLQEERLADRRKS